MTASARPGGVPILSVLSVPAQAFLLGTIAISLVAIVLRYAVGVDDPLFVVSAAGILGLAWTVGLSTERLGSSLQVALFGPRCWSCSGC